MEQTNLTSCKLRKVALQLFSAVLACSLTVGYAYGQESAERGLEIAKERKARDKGWGDTTAKMSMILRNASGDEVERKMRMESLEIQDDGDKALTIFDQPLDVKGTVFLTFSHALEPDDQWMYLPKLSRVKRIRSKNKSGPFMGSEFSFEDMSSFELEKYEFKYLRDEEYDGQSCFVLEQIPTDENSGYSKQILWVDKVHYRALKIEFYDRKNSLLKELINYDYKLYLDKFWRPMRVEVVNKQNGKSTALLTQELQFKTGLDESDFKQNSMKNRR